MNLHKNLSISRPRLDSLMKLKCLDCISTDTEIALEDLVEICKSNEKLRVLWIPKVTWDLEAILPYCPNIEEISFTIQESQKSYAAVAQLPKIKKVNVNKAKHMSSCGKLIELFDAFTHREKDSKLESLMITTKVTIEETSKLIELVDLKKLCCIFEDPKSIQLLTNLTELERLYIVARSSFASGENGCLNVLKSCRKLQHFHINIIVKPDFLDKVLEVLKSVRDPEKQKPLQIYIIGRKQQIGDNMVSFHIMLHAS